LAPKTARCAFTIWPPEARRTFHGGTAGNVFLFSCLASMPGEQAGRGGPARPAGPRDGIWTQRQLIKKLPHAGEVWSRSWHPDNRLLAMRRARPHMSLGRKPASQRAVLPSTPYNVSKLPSNATNGEMFGIGPGHYPTLRFASGTWSRPPLPPPFPPRMPTSSFHRMVSVSSGIATALLASRFCG